MAKRRRVAAEKDYAISKASSGKRLAAPRLPYQPARPRQYAPRIGVIGCGGIIPTHLKAYRKARYQVVAFADPVRERAEHVRDEYYPRAAVYSTTAELLARDDIDVVDVATHPEVREEILLRVLQIFGSKLISASVPISGYVGISVQVPNPKARRPMTWNLSQDSFRC